MFSISSMQLCCLWIDILEEPRKNRRLTPLIQHQILNLTTIINRVVNIQSYVLIIF